MYANLTLRLRQPQRDRVRYPTSGAAGEIVEVLERLRAAHTYHDSKLDFMKNCAYDLGMDDLVKYEADQYVIGREISLHHQNLTPAP